MIVHLGFTKVCMLIYIFEVLHMCQANYLFNTYFDIFRILESFGQDSERPTFCYEAIRKSLLFFIDYNIN